MRADTSAVQFEIDGLIVTVNPFSLNASVDQLETQERSAAAAAIERFVIGECRIVDPSVNVNSFEVLWNDHDRRR